MKANHENRDEHARAWELLPWLANGTLDEWSRARVERHTADCVTCRKELELLCGIGKGMRATDEVPLSAERSLAALQSRIDSDEAAREAAATGWLVELAERFRLPRAALLAAQAALILVLVGWVGWFWWAGQQPSFQTLSAEEEVSTSELPRVRVVFDEQLSVSEMQGILAAIGGTVIDGPTPHGVYTVEVAWAPGSNPRPAEVAAVIQKLREHEGVRFAEPLREGARELEP